MGYDYAKIGRRIVSERARKGWNQDELIQNLNQKGVHVSRNTISKIESGRMGETNTPVNLLMAMCDLFDCEMGYLLCEEGYRGRTRSATDVFKATGLDADAIKGLNQIQNGTVDGTIINDDLYDFKTFFNPTHDQSFDVGPVINWLFRNDNFKVFLCHFAFKLQTVGWDTVFPPDFIQGLELIFKDYEKEGQPRLQLAQSIPLDDLTQYLLKRLRIKIENKEEMKDLINIYINRMMERHERELQKAVEDVESISKKPTEDN